MPVKTKDEYLRVLSMTFEGRYSEGYRYLDRSGELLVRVERHSSLWQVLGVAQQVATLQHEKELFMLNVGTRHVNLSGKNSCSLKDAEAKVRFLGDEAESLYNITTEVLAVPSTTRMGLRFVFAAPADSVEEADRFVYKGA